MSCRKCSNKRIKPPKIIFSRGISNPREVGGRKKKNCKTCRKSQ